MNKWSCLFSLYLTKTLKQIYQKFSFQVSCNLMYSLSIFSFNYCLFSVGIENYIISLLYRFSTELPKVVFSLAKYYKWVFVICLFSWKYLSTSNTMKSRDLIIQKRKDINSCTLTRCNLEREPFILFASTAWDFVSLKYSYGISQGHTDFMNSDGGFKARQIIS